VLKSIASEISKLAEEANNLRDYLAGFQTSQFLP
jgi:hypothetical protein